MPEYETVRRVAHSAQTMYNIVADIEQYPTFLPLCDSLTILSDRQEEGVRHVQADMAVAYKKLRESFRSEVIFDPQNLTITTTNINGPFHHLNNRWYFEALDDHHADVHFKIDYAFKSKPLQLLMGGLFDKAFRTYAKSFEERANELART